MTNGAQKNILLLERSSQNAQQILQTFQGNEKTFKVNHATDIEGGLSYLKKTVPDLVLLDNNLAETKGFASVKSLLAEGKIPYILLSDVNGTEVIRQAEKTGAKEYLVKDRMTPYYLMKTVLSTLKLSETENKLNNVFEEYSTRIESFSMMLDVIKDGVVLIDANNEVQYTNAKASSLFEDEELRKKITAHLTNREVDSEQIIEIKGDAKQNIVLRVNNFYWNKERGNIFVVEVVAPANEAATGASEFMVTGKEHFASKNLYEPVRQLLNEVELVAEHLNAGKYNKAAEHTGFAEDSVAKIETLLGNIKSYIALSNHPLKPEMVSMKTVVADVLESMKPQIEAAKAEINISELPSLNADKELVTKLITELLTNAFKFSRKNKNPVIDIGHDKFDGNIIFCVRDNGVGISRKDHTKIFEFFQTLENENNAGGNGIGLAMGKKIAEAHGGKIWVESLPGHGSNFYFTLSN